MKDDFIFSPKVSLESQVNQTLGQRETMEKYQRENRERLYNHLNNHLTSRSIDIGLLPEHIQQVVLPYLHFEGKLLRSTLLFLTCAAVGGDEEVATPAGAAIEVYHSATLIHDDIIDRSEKRRGHLTVYEQLRQQFLKEIGYSEKEARHYGISLGMLTGSMLQGMAISLLCDLYHHSTVDLKLVLHLVNELTGDVQSKTLEGEALDVQYSKMSADNLNLDYILKMMERKTGTLFSFAARAGAMIGLNAYDPDRPAVRMLSEFASRCAIAFQLQDDILGIIGSEDATGKSVGSDLKEGKMTVILYHSLTNADSEQKAILASTIGNEAATKEDIAKATEVLIELGGVRYAQELAKNYIRDATTLLGKVPLQRKESLPAWAQYLVDRKS